MHQKSTYTKPSLSIDSQINLLKSRGMLFRDIDLAKHYLSHMNYYRLRAYWLPFEMDKINHAFHQNVFFEDILQYYKFDRELRLLILDAIERIEVSVRTQIAYTLSKEKGSHPHLQPEIFNNPKSYAQSITKLNNEYSRSDETFSRHFKENYKEELPPIWAAVELMSIGQISHWFANIKSRSTRNTIAREHYKIDEQILKSFLHHITIVRNICAHHSRLWNRRILIQLKIPKKHDILTPSLQQDKKDVKKLYNTLVFLKYFLDIISPEHSWDLRLKNLLQKYRIDPNAMGFPNHWESLPVWKKYKSQTTKI
jgi:abortive infection bacteriophage resistance protein